MSRPGAGPGSSSVPHPEPTLKMLEPATPAAIAAFRRRVTSFAAAHGAGEELRADVALATSEVVTNVVKYAYDGSGGTIELRAAVAEGWLEIEVSDAGNGFRPGSSTGLGLGLPIVAEVAADLRIDQGGDGTRVAMRFPLGD